MSMSTSEPNHSDTALREQLISDDEEFRSLWLEHQEYEGRLEQLNERPLLSPTDQSEAKRIKLHKLALKDQMQRILRTHASSG